MTRHWQTLIRHAGGKEQATIGAVLGALRRAGRWSRRELAEASRVSLGAIRDIEQGKRLDPGLQTVCRLAKALGCSVDTFARVIPTEGVYPLKAHRTDSTRLHFGKYKGQRLQEVPGDYLQWLVETKPRLLQLGQLEECRRILDQRERERQRTLKDQAKEADRQERIEAGKLRDRIKATRERARTRTGKVDPIMDRALQERVLKQPKTPDPEVFGG
jgi:transcriptional regulator with XRE-family HTH domain